MPALLLVLPLCWPLVLHSSLLLLLLLLLPAQVL
jgi:hypothetical protein